MSHVCNNNRVLALDGEATEVVNRQAIEIAPALQ